MYQIILSIHVLIAVFLIVLVLVQQGKGAGMGSAFGSGASSTVFGSQGSGSFLLKVTGGLAAAFFATSISLGYIANKQVQSGSQGLDFTAPSAEVIPVTETNKIMDNEIPLPKE